MAINYSRTIVSSLLLFLLLANSVSALADGNVFTDPVSSSQWSAVGPSGGDVRVVAIDPRDKNRIYISTLDGQIHTSSDAGRTWQLLVNLNQPQLVLDQLLVDSRDSNIIYTSGHRHKSPGGFFRSTDGGKTWKESAELRNESIHAMTQAIDDPNVLFVGTVNGVWVSEDSGATWTKIVSDSMPININSMAVDPRRRSTIYAGTWWRPYKSTDSGKTWQLIKEGMIDDSDVFAITVNPRNSDHLVASACSGIYESFNAGQKWAKIQGIPAQSRRTRDILQHPTVPGTVFAGTTEGFWMTTNGGKSWMMTTPRTWEINSIAVHPDEPNRVFIGTNNYGVMVSNDGGRNFVPANQNFSSRFTYSILPDATVPNRLYATTQNTAAGGGFFFTSTDGGSTWTPAKSLNPDRIAPHSVLQDRKDPNVLYLGTNIGLFRSPDRGVTWTQVTAPKPPVRRTPAGKGAPAVKPKPAPATKTFVQELIPALTEKVKFLAHTEDDKNGILAATDTGLYRSYDLKKGWERISFGEGLDHNVTTIFATPSVPGTIWAGTATSGVVVSSDDGETWSRVEGLPVNIPVSSIMVDPKRPNYIYVGTIQTFFISRDGGRTWLRRGAGVLPLGNYRSILIDPRNPDEVLIASALENDGGVFHSADAGMTWKRLDSRDMVLPSRRVWMMAFDPADPNRIFAGSHSSGVYRIDRSRGEVVSAGAVNDAGKRADGN
jgi:photosystem II stability/assembly factor-like uncharacterized protein